MNSAEPSKEWSASQQSNNPQYCERPANDQSGSHRKFYQQAEKVQAKQQNQCTRDGSKQRTVLSKKRPDRAGGSSERNEHRRKARHESQRRCKKSSARLLPLAQLLHSDSGEHRNVTRHQRQNTRRKKGNQSGKKGGSQRDVVVHSLFILIRKWLSVGRAASTPKLLPNAIPFNSIVSYIAFARFLSRDR